MGKAPTVTEFDRDVVKYDWAPVRTRCCPVRCTFETTFYPKYTLSCGHVQYEYPSKAPGNKRGKLKRLACRACLNRVPKREVAHG